MKEHEIPDKDLFMMCRQLNRDALSSLPDGYHTRFCRPDELDLWKAIHFDSPHDVEEYRDFMTAYFDTVYAPKGDQFFKTCLFVCQEDDDPIGTGFIWRAYDRITTVHWIKVLKAYEGKGIGRALLSILMQPVAEADYPVYLHTQPGSFRAIKLYSDFGFSLLSNPMIGHRENHLTECLPMLEAFMPLEAFRGLRIEEAPPALLDALADETTDQF